MHFPQALGSYPIDVLMLKREIARCEGDREGIARAGRAFEKWGYLRLASETTENYLDVLDAEQWQLEARMVRTRSGDGGASNGADERTN